MDRPVTGLVSRLLALVALISALPGGVSAHNLIVFASVDCTSVVVEAKFSSGRVAQKGAVRVLDGENILLVETTLSEDGTVSVPLAGLDHSTGLVIEVDTGGHDNYWILTPEDIARKCGS